VTSTAVDIAAWLRRLPHYLYLVDLLPGKRVLEVGCGAGYGAQFLANHGAGRVVGIDRSLRLVTEARGRYRQSNLEFRCEESGSVELEDGSFDIIFVPDGVDVLRRRSVLAELRRLLVRQGHLVLCGLSADRRGAPGGASFYEFRDRLERLFAPVRMIAQAPFVGFSLVEYADDAGSPGIELDTSLLEVAGGSSDAEPSEYVAICGGPGMALRGFTIVQLPDREGIPPVTAAITGSEEPTRSVAPGQAGERAEDPVVARELRSRLETAIEERARAQELIEDLRAQLEELRFQLVDSSTGAAERPAEDAGSDAPSATEQIAEALGAHRDVVRSLEIAVEEGQVYADELRGELEQAQAAARRGDSARRGAEERAARFESELREWRTRASVAEGQLLRVSRGGSGNGALGPGDRVRLAELEKELDQVRDDSRQSAQRLEEAARAASQAASRAERERDDLANRLERVESERPMVVSAARPAREGEVTSRLARLEGELGTGRDLLRQIEDGLTALEKEAARESVERAPSAWAAHRDQQLRELSAELGVKDAEITILHVGVSALRARLKELITEVRRAAGSMRGRSADEMLEVIDDLAAQLSAFEERE
jgi:predicted O-methyltransferase YrrM